MRIALLTREYPPEVYGGAGVHVANLATRLQDHVDINVHCFGQPRQGVTAHSMAPNLNDATIALRALTANISMAASVEAVDLVHSHTWYANMGGHLAKTLRGIPHVITAHSLEPQRSWRSQQLGEGYRLSSWIEKTSYESADAVIAVSAAMRDDILRCYPAVEPNRVHVVHNSIDTEVYYPVRETTVLPRYQLDPARPIVFCVGRITPQKGLQHLIEASYDIEPAAQIVICAGAPDTPADLAEFQALIDRLTRKRSAVLWLRRSPKLSDFRQLLSNADLLVCPSVYEPFGIVNLEAMACATPVVASDVGGIPEVVRDGETGFLVHYDQARITEFRVGLATAINELLSRPGLARTMGEAGRRRVADLFTWDNVVKDVIDVYQAVLDRA